MDKNIQMIVGNKGKVTDLHMGVAFSSVRVDEGLNSDTIITHTLVVPNRIACTLHLGQTVRIYIEPLL